MPDVPGQADSGDEGAGDEDGTVIRLKSIPLRCESSLRSKIYIEIITEPKQAVKAELYLTAPMWKIRLWLILAAFRPLC